MIKLLYGLVKIKIALNENFFICGCFKAQKLIVLIIESFLIVRNEIVFFVIFEEDKKIL